MNMLSATREKEKLSSKRCAIFSQLRVGAIPCVSLTQTMVGLTRLERSAMFLAFIGGEGAIKWGLNFWDYPIRIK